MSAQLAFDTLADVKKLEKAGVTKPIAEAHARVKSDIVRTWMHDQLATKQDLKETCFSLRSELQEFRAELKSEIQEVRYDLKAMANRILVRSGGMWVTSIVILGVMMHLMK